MNPFPFAHSTLSDWQAAVNDCLSRLDPLPPAGGVGFVYASDDFAPHLTPMLEELKAQTGVSSWVGTVGVGICVTGQEYHEQPALALMLADLPPDSYRVFSTIKDDFNEFVTQHSSWYRRHASHLAIVHGDPGNASTPALLAQLTEEIPGGFPVGGLTSSRSEYPQVAGIVTTGGISGLLLAEEVGVATALSQGCSPIGPRHVVTEAYRNFAIRIDGRPALEVFQEDIGEVLARDLSRLGGYIFAGFPIAGSDTGAYLVRNLLGIDPDHRGLAIGEMVQEDQPIIFCRRDGNAAREDLARMLAQLQRRVTSPPRGAVYYSCVGRGRHLFGEDSAELKQIQGVIGDCPLVGFYANGEIFHNRLYGYTGVLTLFL